MKATLNCGSGVATTVVIELSVKEAKALNRVLGTDGYGTQRERGVTQEESEAAYVIYDKLDDVVMAVAILEPQA